ncbi:MAG: hypothetical protein BroJett029_37270 [Alphaproteobacteria bacterium]|nr:MAG: hypothetical protein BroJett029_37270 [Alphaproteobacteria bacterium]
MSDANGRRDSDERTVLPPTKARSGRTTGHVRVILGVSLFLAVIAMGIVLLDWTMGS